MASVRARWCLAPGAGRTLGQDLGTVGHVLAQFRNVLVIDIFHFIDTESAYFPSLSVAARSFYLPWECLLFKNLSIRTAARRRPSSPQSPEGEPAVKAGGWAAMPSPRCCWPSLRGSANCTSSATTSALRRLLPSRSFQARICSVPLTKAAMPLVKYLAANSALLRQQTMSIKSACCWAFWL